MQVKVLMITSDSVFNELEKQNQLFRRRFDIDHFTDYKTARAYIAESNDIYDLIVVDDEMANGRRELKNFLKTLRQQTEDTFVIVFVDDIYVWSRDKNYMKLNRFYFLSAPNKVDLISDSIRVLMKEKIETKKTQSFLDKLLLRHR